MPSLLAEARAKTLTENLFNKVLDELKDGGSASKVGADWWKKNKVELVGLGIAEVTSLLNAAKKKEGLAEKYDELVASMSWKEKVQFLQLGVNQLKKANNKKLRTAALISKLIEASPKVISIILMVV